MNHRRVNAFTLIEAVMAIVILSVALPSMVWALREAHVERVAPVLASKARWLATEKLEDVIADRHSTTRGYTYVVNANYPAEPSIAGFTGFGRTTSITETTADLSTAGLGYKRVTVTVTWTEKGASKSLAVSTVVTDYP